ncbi:MAG: ATP-binding protein [Ahrensia sp.]
MSTHERPPQPDAPSSVWADMQARLRHTGLLLGAVLLVLFVLFATGQLNAPAALACALVIITLSLVLPTHSETHARAADVVREDHTIIAHDDADQAIGLMQALPDPVAVIDAAGTIIFINQHAERLLGGGLVGASAFIRFRDPNVLTILRTAIASASQQEVDYNDRGAFDSWYRFTIAPVARHDPAQSTRYFLIHLRDISESHRLEKMRSDFVGNASHELRTPLASLKGYLETLAGPAKNDAPARERFIGIMQEQAQRMERLIDDLLSLSRFETGVGQVSFAPIDMADVLFHVRSALTPLAETTGATINLDDEMLLEKPLMVRGNRDELIQVFENLVENGVKYGGEQTLVDLRASKATELGRPVLRIEVRDNGPGIAPEHIPRLTERFYRVDVQSSRNKQGTGLGLAIVKHILSRHGGRLFVQSEVGKGSVFVTVLPLLADES